MRPSISPMKRKCLSTNTHITLSKATSKQKPVAPGIIRTTLKAGTFYDGRQFSYSLRPRCNIGRLQLYGRYQHDKVTFPDRDQLFSEHIGSLRSIYMLTIHQSLTVYVQYNSASDKVMTNIRYRYNPREGNDFCLVFNDGLNTSRHREIPVLPVYSDRTVMVKYSYTFRMWEREDARKSEKKWDEVRKYVESTKKWTYLDLLD